MKMEVKECSEAWKEVVGMETSLGGNINKEMRLLWQNVSLCEKWRWGRGWREDVLMFQKKISVGSVLPLMGCGSG